MAHSSQPEKKRRARRNPDSVPVLSILIRVVGVAAVIAIAFWVVTSIGIRTTANSDADFTAVTALNDVKTAQTASLNATGEYQSVDGLISGGFLKAPAAGATAPTVDDVKVALGDKCFVITVRSASKDVYYNWSEPRSSKKLDPNDPPDTSWCAPFPMPPG